MKDGQRVEISPEGWAVSRRIGELISGRESKSSPVSKESWERFSGSEKDAFRQIEQDRTKNDTQGGSALVVDYGDEKAFGGSFRVSEMLLICSDSLVFGSDTAHSFFLSFSDRLSRIIRSWTHWRIQELQI